MEYFKNFKKQLKKYIWVGYTDGDAIELAFCKRQADNRKNWIIENWIINVEPGTSRDGVRFKDFIYKELILFSIADVMRSIPSMVDGLKPAKRKVIFSLFERFLDELTVEQLAGYVSARTAYHHGEKSLCNAIFGMVRDFMGTNNLNLLKPDGQFSTRYSGGKDNAGARYVYTKLSDVTRLLFHEDDDKMLDYLHVDGKTVEPKWYIPIIPLVLVNGARGVATGWRTHVPKYSPQDVIKCIRRRILGEEQEPLIPDFKGFKGTIKKGAIEDGKYKTFIVEGVIEKKGDYWCIQELPVGVWTEDYVKFLESVMVGSTSKKQKLIEDFKQYSNNSVVNIEVKMIDKGSADWTLEMEKEYVVNKLKLKRNITTRNMYLLDPEGKIKRYESLEEIIEDFFEIRHAGYGQRNEHKENRLKGVIKLSKREISFIEMVIDGEIKLIGSTREDLVKDIKMKLGEDEEDDLLSLRADSFSKEALEKLKAKLGDLESELAVMEDLSAENMWINDLDELERHLNLGDLVVGSSANSSGENSPGSSANSSGEGTSKEREQSGSGDNSSGNSPYTKVRRIGDLDIKESGSSSSGRRRRNTTMW